MRRQSQLSILQAYQPSLIDFDENFTGAIFPLMKIYPAEFCVRRALGDSIISPQSLVVETSSGTMALGLAIVCNWYQCCLSIVTDEACDARLQQRLRQLGTEVEVVPKPAATGGYQRARMDRLHEICTKTISSWWVNQYDNPGNPAAYGAFAAQLVESLGRMDCVVGTVGSGGSVCGTATYLRALFPELVVVGVDTFGSVLFGQPDQPRILRGLGNSILPANLDHTIFDEVHWVSAAEAYTATRLLHHQTTLFRGGTTGACWLVAKYWAERHPGARVVWLSPDDGHRYINTIYDDAFMNAHSLLLARLPSAPREVSHPLDAGPSWSYMKWGRRSYEAVTSESFVRTAWT